MIPIKLNTSFSNMIGLLLCIYSGCQEIHASNKMFNETLTCESLFVVYSKICRLHFWRINLLLGHIRYVYRALQLAFSIPSFQPISTIILCSMKSISKFNVNLNHFLFYLGARYAFSAVTNWNFVKWYDINKSV